MQIRRAEAADEEALASIRRRAILALAVPAMSSRFCVHIPFVRTPVSSFGGPGAPERELRLPRV